VGLFGPEPAVAEPATTYLRLALWGVVPLLVMTYAAASLGAAAVATHQLAMTVRTFLAFALDALAIAVQALTGRSLGAGDVAGTAPSPLAWCAGAWSAVWSPAWRCQPPPSFLGSLFTTDPQVRHLRGVVLVVAAVRGPPAAGTAAHGARPPPTGSSNRAQ
jgi:Na+-driven multidrug efflux pump